MALGIGAAIANSRRQEEYYPQPVYRPRYAPAYQPDYYYEQPAPVYRAPQQRVYQAPPPRVQYDNTPYGQWRRGYDRRYPNQVNVGQ